MSVLQVFLLAVMVAGSMACTCSSLHDTKKFCQADYAIIGQILSVTLNEAADAMEYWVDVTTVFKPDIMQPGTRLVATALSSSCGVHSLKPGETYFMTGGVSCGGKPGLDTCTSIVEESSEQWEQWGNDMTNNMPGFGCM